MTRRRTTRRRPPTPGLLALLLLPALPAASAAVPAPEKLSVPTFGQVTLYAPAGAPEQVVLFISGDGGWNLGVVSMAERIRDLGALVVGLDIRTFFKSLEAGERCAYPAGDLEQLSRAVQLHAHLPAYKRPLLVGYSSGATLAYAALAAAPAETFAGAISLGFCADLEIRKAPCQARGLEVTKKSKGVGYDLAPFAGLTLPWHVLHGDADQVCAPAAARAFVARTGAARLHALPKVGHGFSVPRNWEPQFLEAYRAVAAAQPVESAPAAPATAVGVADLAPVEVPATGGPARDFAAVILSGDGGWAEIDKGVAAGLAAAGVPSLGWSSLRYYWTPRTPEGAAADLARLIEHALATWGKTRVLLVGYSFGADVLPFLVNRLPPHVATRVAGVALLGLSDNAAFEFHVTSWLGGGGDARRPTVPEVGRLRVPVTCVRGDEERDSACAHTDGAHVRVVTLPGGHHFGGDYGRVAREILDGLAGRAP